MNIKTTGECPKCENTADYTGEHKCYRCGGERFIGVQRVKIEDVLKYKPYTLEYPNKIKCSKK